MGPLGPPWAPLGPPGDPPAPQRTLAACLMQVGRLEMDRCYFGEAMAVESIGLLLLWRGYGVESVGLLLLRGGYGGGQDFGRVSDVSMAVFRWTCYFGGGRGWIPQDCCSRMQVGRAVSGLLLLRRRYGVDSAGLLQSDVSRGCSDGLLLLRM